MITPSRIFNATLHKPTQQQAAAGVGPPRGRNVPLEASFSDIRRMAREVVVEAREARCKAIFIGGLSSMAIALYEAADEVGLAVLEALTERIQDENNHYEFHDRGFRVLAGTWSSAHE